MTYVIEPAILFIQCLFFMRHVIAALEFSLSVYLVMGKPQTHANSAQFLINYYKNQVFLYPNPDVPCEFALCNVSDSAKESALNVLGITLKDKDTSMCKLRNCLHCTHKQIITLK